MTKKRNGEIDLLRFIFSSMIVIHHYNASFNFNILENGYIAVEFFFLLSGYLMAQSAYKITSKKDKLESSEIADSTWSFIIKKVKAFYPYYAFAVILQVRFRRTRPHLSYFPPRWSPLQCAVWWDPWMQVSFCSSTSFR